VTDVSKRMSKPALFFLTLSCGLWAQSTAAIQGSIQDASGSAVSGAVVKAVYSLTGNASSPFHAEPAQVFRIWEHSLKTDSTKCLATICAAVAGQVAPGRQRQDR